jgi:hypothetical protein
VQQYDPSPAGVGSESAVRITLGDQGAYEPDRLESDTGKRHYFGGGLRSRMINDWIVTRMLT